MSDILAFCLGVLAMAGGGLFFGGSKASKAQDRADENIARDILGRVKKAQIVTKKDSIDELLGE